MRAGLLAIFSMVLLTASLNGLSVQKGGLLTSLVNCEFSLTADPPSFPYANTTQDVEAQVELSIGLQMLGDGTNDYIVTFECPPGGSVTPNTFTISVTQHDNFPVDYSQYVTVTLPAEAGIYSFKVLVNNIEQDEAIGYVVSLYSLLPSSGTWIDDGDYDITTNSYTVPIDDAGQISVSAYTEPVIDGTDLPVEWTLDGGIGTSKLLRTVDLTVAGTTTITCICGVYSETVTIYVVKVSSLMPNNGIEIDDGDNNSNTKSFIVQKASSGTITVDASSYPQLEAEDLPVGWDIFGGDGYDLLFRTASKMEVGEVCITAICGTSIQCVTLYVCEVVVTTDKTNICAGGKSSLPHQTTIEVQVLPVIPNAVVSFAITNGGGHVTSAALTNTTNVALNTNGYAESVLTSSDTLRPSTNPARVTATLNGTTIGGYVDIQFTAPSATYEVTLPELICNTAQTAVVTVTVEHAGSNISAHEIHWRICQIDDNNGQTIWNVTSGQPMPTGYGSIDERDVQTDANGSIWSTYYVRTNPGTIWIDSIDHSIWDQ